MIVGGNVGKIDPAQWPTIGTEEPTGADTSFDKWNYYCGSVWSFLVRPCHHRQPQFPGRFLHSDFALRISEAHPNILNTSLDLKSPRQERFEK